MTLEGFGYNDSSESDDSSEERPSRAPSNIHRAFGRSLRPHISFVRREAAPPSPAPDRVRPPLINLVDTRPPTAEAPIAAPVVVAPEGYAQPVPVPPEAWMANRPLAAASEGVAVTTPEDDTDDDEDEHDDGPDTTTHDLHVSPAMPEARPSVLPSERGSESEPEYVAATFPLPLRNAAFPADVENGYEGLESAVPIGMPTGEVNIPLRSPVPPAEFMAASAALSPEPLRDEPSQPVSAAAAAWHPAWRQNQVSANQASTHYNTWAGQETVTKDELNRETRYAETRGVRRGVVAGFLTGYLIKQYLSNKKMKRFQASTEKQFAQQNERLTKATTEGQVLSQRLATAEERYKQFTRNQPPQQRVEQQTPAAELKPAAPPVQQEITKAGAQELVAQAYDLQPGQRVKRSEWHSVVVDSHGHEVQGAIEYGEEYHHQRRQEQGRAAAAGGTAAQAQGGSAGYQGMSGGVSPLPGLPSGQADFAHELPMSQQSPVDPQHRLQASSRNPVASVSAGRLLWIALAVLLIAFFLSAFL